MRRLRKWWNAYLYRVRERAYYINVSIWKMLIGSALFFFAGHELYKWYSTGQLDMCATGFSVCHVVPVTHSSDPASFDFAAIVWIGCFVLAGPGMASRFLDLAARAKCPYFAAFHTRSRQQKSTRGRLRRLKIVQSSYSAGGAKPRHRVTRDDAAWRSLGVTSHGMMRR
jgi:hypothetical protein